MEKINGNIAVFKIVNRTTLVVDERSVYINMKSIDGWYEVSDEVMDICTNNATFRVSCNAKEFADRYFEWQSMQ